MAQADVTNAQNREVLKNMYYKALIEDVVPFWQHHATDREHGGHLSCLGRGGQLYDGEKFVWMQARAAYTYSLLHNQLSPRADWFRQAEEGVEWLLDHCRDRESKGDFYFSVSREGRPLVAPYNIYADCFALMALAEYAHAEDIRARLNTPPFSGLHVKARDVVKQTYARIQSRKENPKGPYNKIVAKEKSLVSLGWHMMQINLGLVLLQGTDHPTANSVGTNLIESVEWVLEHHLDDARHLVWERIAPDGSHPESMDGRLLTPGHACEVMWMVLQASRLLRRTDWVAPACRGIFYSMERGWDSQYGGLYYYRDSAGLPNEKPESEMKLWWVHVEALYALLLAYKLSGEPVYARWFEQVHDYSWQHFPDPLYGEWFGYLDRRGEPASMLKGGKWKGFFHLPRSLLFCYQLLEEDGWPTGEAKA